jgi:hypothetical protein
VRAALVVSVSVAAACSLYAVDDSFSSGQPDTGGDGGSPSAGCVASLEPGWAVVASSESASALCPASQSQLLVVSDAVAGTDACTCACNETKPASCGSGTLVFTTGDACTDPQGGFVIPSPSACVAFAGGSGTVAPKGKATPLPTTKADCAPALATKPEAVTTTQRRLCIGTGDGAESLCRGEAPVGFAGCIVHDGDVACPAGPFSKRIPAGERATLACAGCTTCETTLTCSAAVARFYNDPACATEVGSRPVNGQCASSANGGGAPFTHLRYDSTASSTCTSTPPATATIAYEGRRTLCCR